MARGSSTRMVELVRFAASRARILAAVFSKSALMRWTGMVRVSDKVHRTYCCGGLLERQLTVLDGELIVDFLPTLRREGNANSALLAVLTHLLLEKGAELLSAEALPEKVDLVWLVQEMRGVGQDDLEDT